MVQENEGKSELSRNANTKDDIQNTVTPAPSQGEVWFSSGGAELEGRRRLEGGNTDNLLETGKHPISLPVGPDHGNPQDQSQHR